jgi:hypothetical protein
MTMTLEKALGILRANEAMLRARGVVHAAIFGSVARGDAHASSDVDVLVELDPQARLGIYDYVRIKLDLADLMKEHVDMVDRAALKAIVKESVLREKIDAF